MEKRTLARPYARALFQLAIEQNAVEAWLAELQTCAAIINTVTKTDVKVYGTMILEVVLPQVGEPMIARVLELLVEKKWLGIFPEVVELFDAFRLEREEKVSATVVSPMTLTQEQKANYQRMVEQHFSRRAEMHYQQNPSMMGGFVAKVGDWVIDGSLPGVLTQLQKWVEQ